MSSHSSLSLPVNGYLRLDVNCPPTYSVFFLLIFNPRSSIALFHSSSFLPTCSLLALHNTISSANSTHKGGCSLMPRPITSSIMSNREGPSGDPICSPTLTVILPVTPIHVFVHPHVSFMSRTYFLGTPCSFKHLQTSSSTPLILSCINR